MPGRSASQQLKSGFSIRNRGKGRGQEKIYFDKNKKPNPK